MQVSVEGRSKHKYSTNTLMRVKLNKCDYLKKTFLHAKNNK